MNKKRHKLRLRKKVSRILVLTLLFMILTTILLLNFNKTFATEVHENSDLTSQNNLQETKSLSNNEYIKKFNKIMENRQKDNTIIYYAGKFKLDINKTLDLVHKFTNNYENELYKKNYIIGPPKIIEKLGTFKSFEAGVVYFIRDLYSYPEKYGMTIEEMRLDETPSINEKRINNKIIMDNGMTFEQYYGKICDLFGIEKSFGLAIVYQESGLMRSGLFKYNNNIGGLRGYAGWMSFPTLEAGIIAHITTIKGIIDNYEFDMTADDSIAVFSGVYVKGNANSIAESWTNKVTYFKEQIENKDLFTIK